VTAETFLEHVCQAVGCPGRHSRKLGPGWCRLSVRERRNWLLSADRAAVQGCWLLPRSPGSHGQEMLCCNPSWHVGSWSRQHTDWGVGRSGWPRVCRCQWSYILQRLRTTTQSLIVLETVWPVTIPTAREQMWKGRGSCSGLTQLVKSRESLACLQLCSGSFVGRWRMLCSCRLAAR